VLYKAAIAQLLRHCTLTWETWIHVRDPYTLCLRKKHHPSYICDNLVRHQPILPILGKNTPQGIRNNNMYTVHHISILYVRTVRCKN